MSTKNYYQKLFVLLSVLLCLFFCMPFLSNRKKVEAESISYTITNASKTDSYFCLRDYDLIMTENQSSFGLCWDFSTTSALESFLARTTGMIYDFSEAWIALCKYIDNNSNTIGSGGGFKDYYNLMIKYGVLLESQFPEEMLFQIDTKNAQEIFDYYSQFANKDLFKNITKTEFINSTDDSSAQSTYILSIKEHLIKNGVLTYSYDDDYRLNQSGQSDNDKKMHFIHRNKSDVNYLTILQGSWHQIIITGWDDNVSFTDKYGNTQTGAFICTNSWGVKETETYYVSYNDLCVNGKKAMGIELSGVNGFASLTQDDFSIRITSTTSHMANLNVKAFDLNDSNDTTGYYLQSNIFYAGEDVNLSYRYYTDVNYNISTRVEKSGQLFDGFDTFILNKTSQTLVLSKENAPSGEYLIWFEIDKNKDNIVDIYYPVSIMVYSGADLSDVVVYDYYNGSYYNVGDNCVKSNFNTILSTEEENVIYGFTKYDRICYMFEFGTLSNIVSHQSLSIAGMSITKNYTSATNVSYANGNLDIYISGLNSYSSNEKRLRLTTSQGKIITIKIITYRIDSDSDADMKTYLFYNLNGGYNNTDNDKFIALGENYNNYILSEPIKSGYEFGGWYLDSALTQKVNNSTLTSSNVIEGNLDNYADKTTTNKYFVMLYAKWQEYQDVTYTGQTISTYHYGDQLLFDFDIAQYGSGNYTYTVLSSLPTGISISGTSLVGQIKSINTITVQIKVKDNETNIEKTAVFNFNVQKRQITFKVHNKQSKFGEDLKKLTGEIVEGTIIDGDNLNIDLHLPLLVNKYSPVGDYTIYASHNNNNYQVTFVNEQNEQQNAFYSIKRTQFNISFENIIATYDGKNHHIDVSNINTSNYENFIIEYSEDDNSYVAENIEVKNYTNGVKIIYIRVSADNYDTEKFTPTITINKKQLGIDIQQAEFTYDGQTHQPVVAANNSDIVLGDLVVLTIADSKINAGSYITDINCSNENYLLTQTTVEYVISKAEPQEKSQTVRIIQDEVALAEKWGDLSLPTGYSWKYPEKKIEFGDNYNTVIFVPSDTNNYKSFEQEVYLSKSEPFDYDLITIIGVAAIIIVVLVLIISSVVKSTSEKYPKTKTQKQKNIKNRPENAEVTIVFVTNSPIVVSPMYGNKRQVMQLPNLTRSYYEFGGWYTDRLFLHPYENNGVEKELILYARWKPKI